MREKENKEYVRKVAKELQDLYDKGNLTEYFDDVLDLSYLVNSKKEYKSVKVFVTLGGPTCWIDTYTKCVELHWGGETASWGLPIDICDYIDEIFQEIYDNV